MKFTMKGKLGRIKARKQLDASYFSSRFSNENLVVSLFHFEQISSARGLTKILLISSWFLILFLFPFTRGSVCVELRYRLRFYFNLERLEAGR